MAGSRRVLTAAVAFALATGSCTGGSERPSTSPVEPGLHLGGTLRVSLITDLRGGLDPQWSYDGRAWELFRCCLLRTLLSYRGDVPSGEGTSLYPDLAAQMPQVSQDGLTWTFTIRSGVRYAPPLQNLAITSQDFVRALEREACKPCSANGYPFYYSIIRGFDDYASRKTTSISGLETPNKQQLVVHLTHPSGDLAYLMAMPATAPIPPNPDRPDDPFGVAEPRADPRGESLVASGPYMLQGADGLDLSAPPVDRKPMPGYRPETGITLVRNPSWKRGTDPFRPAYVREIRVSIGHASSQAAQIERNDIDVSLEFRSAPTRQIQRFASNPSLSSRLVRTDLDGINFVAMNLAVPPFDDVYVRKAVSLAIDRMGLMRIRTSAPEKQPFSPVTGVVASHLLPDRVEGGLLLHFDPYGASTQESAISMARREMAKSRYDLDGDGRCDVAECKNIQLPAIKGSFYVPQSGEIRRELISIGIFLKVRRLPLEAWVSDVSRPDNHVPLTWGSWAVDYPSGSSFFVPLLYGPSISDDENLNASLPGATGGQLRRWGYAVHSVPSIDDRIKNCLPLVGAAEAQCWALLDRYVMLRLVPWVPYLSLTLVQVISANVARFSFDPFTALPALDQIALQVSA